MMLKLVKVCGKLDGSAPMAMACAHVRMNGCV
jgi:hypothetical protein